MNSVEYNKTPKPHPYAEEEPKDAVATKPMDRLEVQTAHQALETIFNSKVRLNNILCFLEGITIIHRAGGFMLETAVRCPEGEVVHVPFMIEDSYSKTMVENRVAQCLISTSIRKALRKGLRVNHDFYNLYSIQIEPNGSDNKTTLIISSGGHSMHVIELPIQMKFTRQELLTQIALQLLPPSKYPKRS